MIVLTESYQNSTGPATEGKGPLSRNYSFSVLYMEDEGKHSAVSSLLVVWHMDYIKQAKLREKEIRTIPYARDEKNIKINAVTSKSSLNKHFKYQLESNIIKPIKILPYINCLSNMFCSHCHLPYSYLGTFHQYQISSGNQIFLHLIHQF